MFRRVSVPRGVIDPAFRSDRRTITNTDTSNLDVLVREAIQNSYDQRTSDSADRAPIIEFRLKELADNERAYLFDTVFGDAPQELFPGIARARNIGRTTCLFITDVNTAGLSGTTNPLDHANKESSNFYRFFWPSKRPASANDGEGGTYGVGRHILHAMSEAETLLVYSRFLRENGQISERFMGVTLADPTGNLMGVHFWASENAASDKPEPLEGRAARDAAIRAGFELGLFEGDATGTVIAVIQPVKVVFDLDNPAIGFDQRQLTDVKGIQRAINLWAWPHIVDGTIRFATATNTGDPSFFTRNRIAELDDWVVAYLGRADDVTEHPVQITQSRFVVGNLRYVKRIVGLGEVDQHLVPQSGIALMRGVKFVVKYLPAEVGADGVGVRGVFVTTPGQVDEVFRNSEPATHDAWTKGGQVGLQEIPNVVEKTFTAISRHLKSAVAGTAGVARTASRGLASLSKRWAQSYFSNSPEMQPDMEFRSTTIDGLSDPSSFTGTKSGGGQTGGSRKRVSASLIKELPGSLKFLPHSQTHYLTEFSWVVPVPSPTPVDIQLETKAFFLTAEGPERVPRGERQEAAQSDADAVILAHFRVQASIESNAFQISFPRNSGSALVQIPGSKLPDSETFVFTVGAIAPIGSAIAIEVGRN